MAVTLGFMFRVDSYPPAVAVPPQVQQIQNPRQPVIEAEKVVQINSSANSEATRTDRQSRFPVAPPGKSAPLTYTQKGAGEHPPVSGRLLDTYA